MNILITGGAGFIGSHLCRYFISQGYRVICVDNLFTGSRDNIADLTGNPRFSFIEQDISLPLYIKEPLEWVMHFASIASPRHYLSYRIKTLKSGLLGTYTCLGIAKEKHAKFFLASTSEIYGDPTVHPQTEEYNGNVNTIGPRSCYDESKRSAEALTYAYQYEWKLDVRVARIFNTYGEHMQIDDGRVISNFIVQALRGQPISVYGQGAQTRSFCYVSDLIHGIEKLMNADYALPMNLGNPHELKVIDLAKEIIRLARSDSRVEYFPLPEDDPHRRRPDITKANTLLKWAPQVSLEEGLTRTIEYFNRKLNQERDAHS
ncbi:MAG: SDR family oxidoreductase [Candidatus Omnitrophica bacterium]|nr:SDR family oxidoreductase [Candidatus Omnitrophota bacterium]